MVLDNPDALLNEIERLAEVERRIRRQLQRLADYARRHGCTWQEIADAAAVSKPVAYERWHSPALAKRRGRAAAIRRDARTWRTGQTELPLG